MIMYVISKDFLSKSLLCFLTRFLVFVEWVIYCRLFSWQNLTYFLYKIGKKFNDPCKMSAKISDAHCPHPLVQLVFVCLFSAVIICSNLAYITLFIYHLYQT